MKASTSQRIDMLEAEVARLRQVIEDRPSVSLIPVTEAARLAGVSTQSIRNWIDRYHIGQFVAPGYLVDRRRLREHLIRHRGKLPPEMSRE